MPVGGVTGRHSHSVMLVVDETLLAPDAVFNLAMAISSASYLGEVRIGDNVRISQGAYLCTGSHDWRDMRFALVTRPIAVESGAWIGAHARVAPGVCVGSGAVLVLGAVATRDLKVDWIHQGIPAVPVRPRYHARETEMSF
jgi:acetyltransferase-like isoleucine patch superfamily enzyme